MGERDGSKKIFERSPFPNLALHQVLLNVCCYGNFIGLRTKLVYITLLLYGLNKHM